jgi:hypothetical protein
VWISAQVDFVIVLLTKRKNNLKLTASKFDGPKHWLDAPHRIALEIVFDCRMAGDPAMILKRK